MTEEKKSLWKRLHVKYRVVVVNDNTLGEMAHLRLSLMNLLLVFFVLLIVALSLLSLLVWTTPLRNYLPGGGEADREVLVKQNARVDSLMDIINSQNAYLESFKKVIAGELDAAHIDELDSIALEADDKMELVDEKSAATAAFMSEYEGNVLNSDSDAKGSPKTKKKR